MIGVGIDADSNATVTWTQCQENGSPVAIINAAKRISVDGAWGTRELVSEGMRFFEEQFEVNAPCTALLLYRQVPGFNLITSRRSPAGEFGVPTVLTSPDVKLSNRTVMDLSAKFGRQSALQLLQAAPGVLAHIGVVEVPMSDHASHSSTSEVPGDDEHDGHSKQARRDLRAVAYPHSNFGDTALPDWVRDRRGARTRPGSMVGSCGRSLGRPGHRTGVLLRVRAFGCAVAPWWPPDASRRSRRTCSRHIVDRDDGDRRHRRGAGGPRCYERRTERSRCSGRAWPPPSPLRSW